MAHFLDNDWTLLVIEFPGGVPKLTKDGTFHLVHNASNQLDSTSKHGANDLTGNSRPDGGGFEIRFSEKVPDGHGGHQFRPYTGNLMDHRLVNGVEHKVIGGFRGGLLVNQPKADDFRLIAFAQNEGVWVGTQP